MLAVRAAALLGLALATAAACSSFGSDSGAAADDAGADVASPPADDARPTSPPDSGGDVEVPPARKCQPAAFAGACTAGMTGSCPTRELFAAKNATSSFPTQIVVDDASVYWAEQASPSWAVLARVLRTDRNGSLDESRADVLAASQPQGGGVALDGVSLYWTTLDSAGVVTLHAVPRTCSAPCTAAPQGQTSSARVDALVRSSPGLLFGIAPSSDLIRFATASGVANSAGVYVEGLAVTDAWLYGVSPGSSAVERLSLDATTHVPFATLPVADGGALGLDALTTDCRALWGTRTGPAWPTLVRVDLTTAAVDPERPLNVGTNRVNTVVADERYVYLATVAGFYAFEKATGILSTVSAANVWAVAVDDRGVYWGENYSGRIRMLVKQ